MTTGIGIQEAAQCCAALMNPERDELNRAIELGGDLPPGQSAEIIPQDDLAMIPIQGAKQGHQQGAVVMPHEVLKRIIAVPFTAHMGETAGLAVEIPKNAVQRQLARGEVRSDRTCWFYGFVWLWRRQKRREGENFRRHETGQQVVYLGVEGMGQERDESRRNFTPGVFPVGNHGWCDGHAQLMAVICVGLLGFEPLLAERLKTLAQVMNGWIHTVTDTWCLGCLTHLGF